jgi:hypothetical protein
MSQKAFDSDQGRKLFSKLESGLNELKKLKREMASGDPAMVKNAIDQMRGYLKGGEEIIQRLKDRNPHQFEQIVQVLRDLNHYTDSQKETLHELEEVFSGEKPDVELVQAKKQKKKFVSKKWKRS